MYVHVLLCSMLIDVIVVIFAVDAVVAQLLFIASEFVGLIFTVYVYSKIVISK